MTTPTIEKHTAILEYDLTVGLSAMEGRGFYYPTDTAIAPNGRLYVPKPLGGRSGAWRPCHRLRHRQRVLRHVRILRGHDPGEFVWASGITADREGRLFISDEYTNRITVFDLDGNYQTSWGTTGSDEGQMDGPSGLAIGADAQSMSRTPITTESKIHAQRRLPRELRLARDRRRRIRPAWGLTVAPGGDVYVADWGNDRIQRFSGRRRFMAATAPPAQVMVSCAGRPAWQWMSVGTST